MTVELQIPPAANDDPEARELISVWAAGGKLHCVLSIGCWKDRGIDEANAWGLVLADTIHHVANALNAKFGSDSEQTADKIISALKVEMQHPTSTRLGDFIAD